MSALLEAAPPPEVEIVPEALPMPGHGNGTIGMKLFIATEAALFVMLFFAYFLLVPRGPSALNDAPPKLTLALVMLVTLLTSSVVLHLGEKRAAAGRHDLGRGAMVLTILLGLLFLGLQALEYRNHLKTLTPATDAYGSIFYTLTSIHGFHLLLGALMLLYVALLPRGAADPRRWRASFHNAALYWHFVDVVWVLIVALVYLLPHLQR